MTARFDSYLRYLLALAALLLLVSVAHCQTITTATISVTNAAGTTNGQTITINGVTRTWTNSVYTPATQILTNSTAETAATNLFRQLASYLIPGGTTISYGSSTGILARGFPSQTLTVTLSAGWGTVSYSTNTLTTATVLRLPVTVEAQEQQTNLSTRLVDALNLTAVTNQLSQSRPAFAQLLGTTNAQTITGNKTFTGTNTLGYIGHGTNGTLWAPTLVSARSTNMIQYIVNPADGSGMTGLQVGSGYLWRDTNGNPIFAFSPVTFVFYTNATFYGTLDVRDTFSIYGSGLGLSNIPPAAISWTNGTRFEATNSFSDIALRRFAIASLANGNNAGVIVGTNSYVEVSGPTASFTVCGLNGSPLRDGQVVIIDNNTTYDMTIAHQSGADPVAANRIITNTGADRSTTGNGTAILIYSAAASRWKLISLDQ